MAKRRGPADTRPRKAVLQKAALAKLISRHGYKDFKWIAPRDILVADWVRMKCLFGYAFLLIE
jgi:hypothetical protein